MDTDQNNSITSFLNKLRNRRIIFVYADANRYTGSTVMRGAQLAEITKKLLADHRVSYKSLSYNPRNCLLILTKGAYQSVGKEKISHLKNRGNIVLCDPVDATLDVERLNLFDGVVASSLEAYDKYRQVLSVPSHIIHHHVDPRVAKTYSHQTFSSPSVGYFGEIINTVKTPHLEELIDYIGVDTSKQDESWLQRISNYNVHYAVRSARAIDGFKPFLKGFTAAFCESAIIIQRDQKEALRWLGEDYPYLLPENPSESEIVDMINLINDTYGTDTWNKAINTMQRIKLSVSNEQIVNQIRTVTEFYKDL